MFKELKDAIMAVFETQTAIKGFFFSFLTFGFGSFLIDFDTAQRVIQITGGLFAAILTLVSIYVQSQKAAMNNIEIEERLRGIKKHDDHDDKG